MSDSANPYASPESIPSREQRAAAVVPFASGHGRAVAAMCLLAVVVVLQIADMTIAVIGIQDPGYDQITTVEDLKRPLVGAQFAVNGMLMIGTIVAFIAYYMWKHRAYRNLRALGARHLEFTPGWVVGYYFIPILNLFRPYLAMKEIWLKSDPLGAPKRFTPAPLQLKLWWTAWLTASFLGPISGFLRIRRSANNLTTAEWVEILATALWIVAITLLIRLIYFIDRRQDAKAATSTTGELPEPLFL
jgi:hypothetical protein